MIKVKKYVVVQIYCEEKDGKLDFYENWWPRFHDTFTEAKNSLVEEVDDVNASANELNTVPFDYKDGKMVYIEICSAIYYKEHRNEYIDEDGEHDCIKCHYCLVPRNCPESIRRFIREMNSCPVVKYKEN